MAQQKWRVVVAKLGASNVLHESDVEANNWMSALRAARQAMSERPSVPPGASCSIDAQGVATVLDPGSRRKFVLSPLTPNTAKAEPPAAAAASRAPAPAPEQNKKKKFQTVALIPDEARAPKVSVPVAGPTNSSAPAHSSGMPRPSDRTAATQPAQPTNESAVHALDSAKERKKKKFETVAFTDAAGRGRGNSRAPGSSQPGRRTSQGPRGDAPRASLRPPVELELLLERNEDPTPENPLCYRERAYVLSKGNTVPEAEAALRWKLAELQRQLEERPRGRFVNLAVFDHRWHDVPERPPIIVLQWRDWRGEVTVDYPAAARVSSLPPPSRPQDDRLADLFEALEGLPRVQTAAEGLDFAVQLLERTLPCEAITACLYDINTDELRFVALSGTGAAGLQGRAIPRSAGLFGQAARAEHQTSVFADVLVEPAFNPEIDSRPGLEARDMLLRPIAHERQLLGMLQLVNRKGARGFSAEDVSAVNYLADRLGEFLHAARLRRRSHS